MESWTPAVPFKAKAACRHHIPKQRHRITNWAAYDAGLRARGSLTVWFTPEAVAAWAAAPWHLVAWIGGTGALSPTRVPGYAMRTYFGRPSSSIRFSTSTAMAISLAWRPSVWKRSPLPMTRFHLEMSASTRARQLYPGLASEKWRVPDER